MYYIAQVLPLNLILNIGLMFKGINSYLRMCAFCLAVASRPQGDYEYACMNTCTPRGRGIWSAPFKHSHAILNATEKDGRIFTEEFDMFQIPQYAPG